MSAEGSNHRLQGDSTSNDRSNYFENKYLKFQNKKEFYVLRLLNSCFISSFLAFNENYLLDDKLFYLEH